jgi:hypothetical protein
MNFLSIRVITPGLPRRFSLKVLPVILQKGFWAEQIAVRHSDMRSEVEDKQPGFSCIMPQASWQPVKLFRTSHWAPVLAWRQLVADVLASVGVFAQLFIEVDLEVSTQICVACTCF